MSSWPRCPRGCNWNPDGRNRGNTDVMKQLEWQLGVITGDCNATIICPVCSSPIDVDVTLEPRYESRKGTGWPESAAS